MKKIILWGIVCAMAVMLFAYESLDPGVTPLKAADTEAFAAAGEHIVGGGDT